MTANGSRYLIENYLLSVELTKMERNECDLTFLSSRIEKEIVDDYYKIVYSE